EGEKAARDGVAWKVEDHLHRSVEKLEVLADVGTPGRFVATVDPLDGEGGGAHGPGALGVNPLEPCRGVEKISGAPHPAVVLVAEPPGRGGFRLAGQNGDLPGLGVARRRGMGGALQDLLQKRAGYGGGQKGPLRMTGPGQGDEELVVPHGGHYRTADSRPGKEPKLS